MQRHVAAVAASLAVLLLSLGAAVAQQVTPLLGQGDRSTSDPFLTINYSLYLDRVIEVDQFSNKYSAAWWVWLRWEDASAADLILNATTRWATAGLCSRPCDSMGLVSQGCCDSIYLPHIEMPNLLFVSQDLVQRYQIGRDPATGSMYWYARVVGTFFSPFDFHAFPFDHQHLLVEAMLPPSANSIGVGLKMQAVGRLQTSPHARGEDVSGWTINWYKIKAYNSSECYLNATVTPPLTQLYNVTALASGAGASNYTISALPIFAANNTGKTLVRPENCAGYTEGPKRMYNPYTIVVDVMIKRTRSYYILSSMLPVVLVDWLAFVVYFMDKTHLEARMGVIITLVLALTALNFISDFPPSNYLNAIQQLVVLSYIVMFLIAMDCICAYTIAVTNKRREERKMRKVALKEYKIVRRSVTSGHPGTAGGRANRTSSSGLPPVLEQHGGSRTSMESSDYDGANTNGTGFTMAMGIGTRHLSLEMGELTSRGASGASDCAQQQPQQPIVPYAKDPASLDSKPSAMFLGMGCRPQPSRELTQESTDFSTSGGSPFASAPNSTLALGPASSSSLAPNPSAPPPLPLSFAVAPVHPAGTTNRHPPADGGAKPYGTSNGANALGGKGPAVPPDLSADSLSTAPLAAAMVGSDTEGAPGGGSGAALGKRTRPSMSQKLLRLVRFTTPKRRAMFDLFKEEAWVMLVLDKTERWVSLFLFLGFNVSLIVIMCVAALEGDHKLMLGGNKGGIS